MGIYSGYINILQIPKFHLTIKTFCSAPKQSIFEICAMCKYLTKRKAAAWFPCFCLKRGIFNGKIEKAKCLTSSPSTVSLPVGQWLGHALVLHCGFVHVSVSYSRGRCRWPDALWFRCGLCSACQFRQLGTSYCETPLSVAYNSAKLSLVERRGDVPGLCFRQCALEEISSLLQSSRRTRLRKMLFFSCKLLGSMFNPFFEVLVL